MSSTLIDARSHEVESVHMPIEATHPDRFTGRTAGLTALVSVGLCIAGAMTQQLSGANLYAAMEDGTRSEALAHLTDVAAAKGQLVVGLGIWMLAFPMFAIAGTLLADLGTDRKVARLSRMAFTASLAAIVVFLVLMMSFVVGVAPAHAAGDDVWALARTIGFAASTTDWIVTALVMGFGPVLAVWAGRTSWAPRWLQKFAVVTLVVTFVELLALAIDNRGLVFILVPVGLAHMAACGIAALRFDR